MEKVESTSPIAGKMSSAALRKIKKPIIEKRRRERINDSLNALKSLVLDAMQKDESRYSKMEKADILEMTVHHLKGVHRQQAAQLDAHHLNQKYTAGYSECANEVAQFLNTTEYLTPELRLGIMSHLSQSLAKSSQRPTKIQAPKPIMATPAFSSPAMAPVSTLPCATQIASLPGSSGAQYPASVSPLSLITSQQSLTLPSGVLVIQPTSPGSTASMSPSNMSSTSSSPAHSSFSSMSPSSQSSSPSSPVSGAIPLYVSPTGARYSPISPCERPSSSQSLSPPPADDAPHHYYQYSERMVRDTVISKHSHYHQSSSISNCKNQERMDLGMVSQGSMWRPW